MTTDDSSMITLGVFGASGRTGKCVVEYALEIGWAVKAMVRTPSNFDLRHDRLTVVEGDFSTENAVRETVSGTDYVVCCGGGPHNPRTYERRFMEKFVREQLWPALQESKPKALLFQGGALSKISRIPTFAQLVVAPMLGLVPMAKDNDAVMRFVHKNPLDSTRVVITRPAKLVEGKGGAKLGPSFFPATFPVTFKDLGKFNVDTVANENFTWKYPYVTKKAG